VVVATVLGFRSSVATAIRRAGATMHRKSSLCDVLHTEVLSLLGNFLFHDPPKGEPDDHGGGYMRRPIAIASAVMMLSLLALMFSEMHREATAKTAAPVPEYVLSDHSYLPIQDLEPVW